MAKKDYTGQRCGTRTFTHATTETSKDGSIIWEAICDCGKTSKVVPHLVLKNNQSCFSCVRQSKPDDFWANVRKGAENECWPWQGAIDRGGYGRPNYQAKPWRAHRLAYTLTYGEIPEGMCICHKCDNPPCCNPNHLFVGSSADNVADKIAKGRDRVLKGEDSPHAILTEEKVRAIRAEPTDIPARVLAEKYGCKKSSIDNVRQGKRWKWVK